MEHQENLAGILKHRGKSYLLSALPKDWKDALTTVEKKIVDARLTGLSFSQLESAKHEIDQIMLRGAAISGCALPSTEFFADIIASEIEIFVKNFGYEQFTLSEILLAMRLNAKGGLKYPSGVEMESVHFTGTCINVDYLSKVLSNYKSIRDLLNRKFENYIDGYK